MLPEFSARKASAIYVDFVNRVVIGYEPYERRLCNCGCMSRGPAFHAGPRLKGDPTLTEKISFLGAIAALRKDSKY